jgi:hypothetical protein
VATVQRAQLDYPGSGGQVHDRGRVCIELGPVGPDDVEQGEKGELAVPLDQLLQRRLTGIVQVG